jgi:hypothetical protein
MKVSSTDFRVQQGHQVKLDKWPTAVEPIYESKKQYQKLLRDHVAQLSSLQQLLCVQSLCSPADFPSNGRGGERRRNQARDVRGQSARLPSV